MTKTGRFVSFLCAASLALTPVTTSCSMVDPADQKELEDRINALPADSMRALREWAARTTVIKYLLKDPNKKAGHIECRGYWPQTQDEEWTYAETATEWIWHVDITAELIAGCMTAMSLGYSACVEHLALVKQEEGQKLMGPMFKDMQNQCRAVLDPDFDADWVAAEARGVNESNPGDMNRLWELLTVGQVVDSILISDVPPPLPGGAIGSLLPVLCALNVGWGCPGDPAYPGAPAPAPSAPDHGTPQ